MELAVIGTGNMGQALVRSFLQQKLIEGPNIRAFDTEPGKAAEFALAIGAQPFDSAAAASAGADMILLAVKPQVIEAAIAAFTSQLQESTLLISIAAGVSLNRLRFLAGPLPALARVMPNMPAMIGSGVSAVCYDRASQQQRQAVENLLASCGLVFNIRENLMDAVTGLSGSGPAYVMLMVEAMADAGVAQGLNRDMALQMAAMTLMGSAKMILETGIHPAVLKDQVCSPGGTTIDAVISLEENGLRAALINAVCIAADKSRQIREQASDHG
jgi:pyrroline-5-carboxylate reductase